MPTRSKEKQMFWNRYMFGIGDVWNRYSKQRTQIQNTKEFLQISKIKTDNLIFS